MGCDRIGAVAVRQHRGRLQVALVTTRLKGRWSLPKGRLEDHLDGHGVAALEAFEEAGIIAVPGGGDPLMVRCRRRGRSMRLHLHLLCIDRVLRRWPERGERRRKLVRIDRLERFVRDPKVVSAALALIRPLTDRG